MGYWLVMDRRVQWQDKQTELEIQTFNLFPDRWAEVYRERLLGGGDGSSRSYNGQAGDYGLAFGGEPELAVTIEDLHTLDDYVDNIDQPRRMSGAMAHNQDTTAVLGYVAPGDKGRLV